MHQSTSTALALLLLSLGAFGQQSANLDAALNTWRAKHGTGWIAHIDPRTGLVHSLYGSRSGEPARLFDDAMAMARAREHLRDSAELTGLELSTLVDERAAFLPLSHAGSSDKYSARFVQVVRGVPVVGASVNVLMDSDGRLLSIESSALPETQALTTHPLRSSEALKSQALRSFAALAQTSGSVEGEPRLVLDPSRDLQAPAAALAWEVRVFGEGANGVPRGVCLRLADSDLRTTSTEELVHTCDVTGTVYTRLTPGVLPDIGSNSPVLVPMAHVQIASGQGNAISDANGNFNIVGASAPLSVSVRYDGPFTTTVNAQGPAFTLPASLSAASGNVLVMNSPAQADFTAEANSAHWIGRLRDWVRMVNPTDATADFDARSIVNLPQTCNAYFDGSSVNFFSAGGGCVNTAYSTVVAHEMGHWLNGRYGSGNGPDGFGEGNADNFATFLTDQPVVGANFFNGGGAIRSGLNTRMFCGDTSPGCYGEVHADGEVLMGACWKVRTRLKNSLGASAGAAAADVLFSSWMNAYDDTMIKTAIRTHWLVLDDDDGDINNGTPNYSAINLGFADQGFPPYLPLAVSIIGMTLLENTTDEVGPYVVSARITANVAPPLLQPQLFWRVNGAAFSALPMTALGADQWQAAIPGQLSPAKVEYYVRGVDSIANAAYAPGGAPVTLQRFVVGDERVYFHDAFDGPISYWIAGASAGTSDWQYGFPQGKSGDPSLGRTGLRCWGNDIGLGNNDGLYAANSVNWLQSPPINLSNCPNPRLRLQRWLNIENATHDSARILVNGQVVWQHTGTLDLIDLAWTEMELDIQAIAAGNPATIVRFELGSDAQIERGGWNIDDVQIVSISGVGLGCLDALPYCTAKLSSVGTLPFLEAVGSTSVSLANLRIDLLEGTYHKVGVLFHSASGPNATPFAGGTLCVQPPIVRDGSFTTDAFGYAQFPFAPPPSAVGQTWYVQAWFRDPPASSGIGLSRALELRICP
jgi:hypothetical protein